jgi:hypothetical protein
MRKGLTDPNVRLRVIRGDDLPRHTPTSDEVIAEECEAFVARLKLRAAALHPDDAAAVVSLADRLRALAES